MKKICITCKQPFETEDRTEEECLLCSMDRELQNDIDRDNES